MRCGLALRLSNAPPTAPTAALNTDTPICVRASRLPVPLDDFWLPSPFELLAVELALLVALLVAELARLAALDPFERDRLAALFVVPVLEFEPDPLVPLLDVEREVELPVRFAWVRPRLLPRRD